MKTTVNLDDKLHALALKHGINLSGTARRAIQAKVEDAERVEKRILQKDRKEKKHFAELLPLEVDDIVLESDCNGG